MDGITVKRTVNSSVLVTWTPVEMSSDETGGSHLYIVTYNPLDGGRTSSSITTSNSVSLPGLDSGDSYVISVLVTFERVMSKDDLTPGMYRDDKYSQSQTAIRESDIFIFFSMYRTKSKVSSVSTSGL